VNSLIQIETDSIQMCLLSFDLAVLVKSRLGYCVISYIQNLCHLYSNHELLPLVRVCKFDAHNHLFNMIILFKECLLLLLRTRSAHVEPIRETRVSL